MKYIFINYINNIIYSQQHLKVSILYRVLQLTIAIILYNYINYKIQKIRGYL